MRIEPVEVFSDATNMGVLRHPGRRFPGLLVQGDDLYHLCLLADGACESTGRTGPAFDDLNALRNALWTRLNHYRSVLDEHGIAMPFSEQPVRK